MIVIRHSSRIFSVYAHLQAESVSLGQRVQAGQPIGLIGDSGSAKGQGHLHVAVVVATETQLDALRNAVRTVPKEMCRDPWPLITHEKMLSVLGTMIPYMEGGADDMRFPKGWNPVHNKRTIILASETPNPDVGTKGPVNLRSMPGESEPLPDATIVQTIKERTYLNVRGYVDTPIGRWYGGELWWGQSWVLLFVHSALCTQLEDIYKPDTELVKKLEQIAEIATSD